MRGEYSEEINEAIYYATAAIIRYQWQIYLFIVEIAYRTGYANSILAEEMSENTYKKKKKAVRENILKALERS